MPAYMVVVTPSPASSLAVRSTAVFVEAARRLPEINNRCSDRFITIMIVGVTAGVLVTPTTIMPGLESTDAARLAALRAGDERVFAQLVDEFSPRMLKLARVYLAGAALAEEAVQEAWIVFLERLDRFEGRSSLSTWVLGIVANVARASGRHESRSRPFSSLSTTEEPVIDPERFLPPDHERWPNHWAIPPAPWPERALETAEAARIIRETVRALPETQRAVITLRDMIGCTAAETCNTLGLTDTNQRVILHRARTKVRGALEAAFDTTEAVT
jgi:RNA polymerase sigma-70 factor, ECF subfamily